MENLKIILADDHLVFRVGLESVLIRILNNASFIHAENGSDIFSILEQKTIDLILLDLAMPVLDGYSTLEKLQKMKNKPKVLVLSFHDDADTILRCIKLGAHGYLQKDAGINTIRAAISTVLNNELYYSVAHSSISPSFSSDFQITEKLNATEIKIVYYILQQLTSKEIAVKMNLSKRTIDSYRNKILSKTNSKNILGLVSLLPPPPPLHHAPNVE
jgi:two-component system response regulator DegU